MSSVLKALEDFNFEVFDNFPLALVDSLLEQAGQNNRPALADRDRDRHAHVGLFGFGGSGSWPSGGRGGFCS
jgi:hypothetical protein